MDIIIPKFEYVMSIKLKLGTLRKITGMPNGSTRMFIDITGGTFEGPNIKGIVLPGTGGDYPLVGDDNVLDFDARYLLKEDDGTIIYLQNRGYRWGSQKVMQDISEHKDVDPSMYYMRTAPKFEVTAGKHDWLTKHIFVGTGRKTVDGNIIDYFKVI